MKTRQNTNTQQQEEISELPVETGHEVNSVSQANTSLNSNLEMPMTGGQISHQGHYPQLRIIPLPSSQVAPLNLGDTQSQFYQRHSQDTSQGFKTVDSFYDSQLSLPSSHSSKPSSFQPGPSKTGAKLDQIIGDFLAAILKGLLVLFGIKKMDKPTNKPKTIRK